MQESFQKSGTIGYGLTAPVAGMLVQNYGLIGATVFGLGNAVGGFTGGLQLESVG